MAKTDLTAARLRELLHYDPGTGVFTWLAKSHHRSRVQIGGVAGGLGAGGYWQIGIDMVLHKAHRLAWLHHYGEWPDGGLDHINRVTTDNRIANLRIASQSQNRQNTLTRRDSKSGIKGVYWHKKTGKWCAAIGNLGKIHHIGLYDNIDCAAQAYANAASKIHTCNPSSKQAQQSAADGAPPGIVSAFAVAEALAEHGPRECAA